MTLIGIKNRAVTSIDFQLQPIIVNDIMLQ